MISQKGNAVRNLNAFTATLILISYVITQLLSAVLFVIVVFGVARFNQIAELEQILGFTEANIPFFLVLSPVVGTLTVLAVSRSLIPTSLGDNSSFGVALIRGPWLTLASGLCAGLIIGTGTFLWFNKIPAPEEGLGHLARMAYTSRATQLAWIVIAVLLAPINEEILFRGVLFGGYRKSFGVGWAGVLTTVLFLLLHLPEGMRFPPLFVSSAVLSVVALRYRLRAGAVGAAVAVHSGANLMICILFLSGQAEV